MIRFYFLLICLILLFFSCKNTKQRSISPAFYHWKNSLEISTSESEYLSKFGVKKLYIRFFDVDWQDQNTIPLSVIEHKSKIADSIQVIPTVFITNRTMLNIEENNISALGDKIFQKINALSTSFSKNVIKEIQFDCDWSPTSQYNYFNLLQFLKSKFANQGQIISATIRLHQVKYFKTTGVPPIDRGVLMFYNMDDINNKETQNSIINIEIAKQYLYNFEHYPIPLDIALPIFKWGIVFQDNKFIKIINNLDQKDLSDTTRYLKIAENQFEILKSTYLKGYYLYQKDQIRLEQVSVEPLQKAADLLSPILSTNDLNIIFYHLDSTLIADYPYEVLKDIYSRFY